MGKKRTPIKPTLNEAIRLIDKGFDDRQQRASNRDILAEIKSQYSELYWEQAGRLADAACLKQIAETRKRALRDSRKPSPRQMILPKMVEHMLPYLSEKIPVYPDGNDLDVDPHALPWDRPFLMSVAELQRYVAVDAKMLKDHQTKHDHIARLARLAKKGSGGDLDMRVLEAVGGEIVETKLEETQPADV